MLWSGLGRNGLIIDDDMCVDSCRHVLSSTSTVAARLQRPGLLQRGKGYAPRPANKLCCCTCYALRFHLLIQSQLNTSNVPHMRMWQTRPRDSNTTHLCSVQVA